MPSGLAAAGLANPWLSGSAVAGLAAPWVQLHTGEPGPAGTVNVSSVTTRLAVTWAAVAGGVLSAVATFPVWASWAGSAETETNISLWTAATGGTFLFSVLLGTAKAVYPGDTLTLSSLSLSLSPIAA